MVALFNELDQEIFGTAPGAPGTTPDTADSGEDQEVLARNRGIEAAFDTPLPSASASQTPLASHVGASRTASNAPPFGLTPSMSLGGMQTGPSASASSITHDRTPSPITPTPPSSTLLSPSVPPPATSVTQEPVQDVAPPAKPKRAKTSKKKPATSDAAPPADASTSRPRRSGRRN